MLLWRETEYGCACHHHQKSALVDEVISRSLGLYISPGTQRANQLEWNTPFAVQCSMSLPGTQIIFISVKGIPVYRKSFGSQAMEEMIARVHNSIIQCELRERLAGRIPRQEQHKSHLPWCYEAGANEGPSSFRTARTASRTAACLTYLI